MLGSMKKYMDAATIAVAKVITAKSLSVRLNINAPYLYDIYGYTYKMIILY